jgi:cell division protein FtsQ
MLKKVIYISLTALILGGVIFLASFAGVEHRQSVYRTFSLNIVNPPEQWLITEDELRELVENQFGETEGKDLNSVPIFEIEQFIKSHPYVENTNLYTTLNGNIVVSVSLRRPMVRVINSFDESFLLDTLGEVMPISLKHPVRTLVASGDITIAIDSIPDNLQELEGTFILSNILTVAKMIYKDKFLHALISQIYVKNGEELELIPAIGNQVIILGSSDYAAEKMLKLKAFYLQVLAHTGLDKYSTINLTFDNQVVCSK